MLITTGIKREQLDALWTMAQEALIVQSEFFAILNQGGAIALLEECLKKGVLSLSKPARAEMDFELMANQEYYTPNSLFFTSSHGSPPSVDIKNWKLSVEGDGVGKPFSLNYDDLLKLPHTTVTRYLECASNGSAFYDLLLNKKAEGPQWHFGGYGIAEWTGVPLAELLKLANIKDKAVEVMPVGLDSPPGGRPIPVAKAMEEDTILAYIMNGRVLPPDHGFPLRAIVPGWIGAASIKWVSKIIVSTQPIQVANNTDRYVLIGPDYQPQPPAKGPVITTQLVKSACCLPWQATLKAGHQKIVGYAWSPFGKIAKVEVSLDDGKTFQPATLVGPNIERAGTRWELHFHPKPGNMTITPRATDEKGNTQYDIFRQKWNRLGYLFGAMVPHPVTVLAGSGAEEKACADYSLMCPQVSGCC
jgi:sulfane dehydrogenase subunit SoxC